MYTSRSTLTRIAISKTDAIGARTTAAVFLLLDIFSDPDIWEMNTFHKSAARRSMRARNAGDRQIHVRSTLKPASTDLSGSPAMPRAAFLPLLAASFASKGLYGAGLVSGLALIMPAAAQTHASAPRVASESKEIPSRMTTPSAADRPSSAASPRPPRQPGAPHATPAHAPPARRLVCAIRRRPADRPRRVQARHAARQPDGGPRIRGVVAGCPCVGNGPCIAAANAAGRIRRHEAGNLAGVRQPARHARLVRMP